MSQDRVRIEIDDHVALVTLARPEKHNALDLAMFEAIIAAAAQLAGEPGLRAVVLHGDGPSFCSGIDLMSLAGAAGGGAGPGGLARPARRSRPNLFQAAAFGWVSLPGPVIPSLPGNCL